jgi:hypothetical protein
MDISVHPSARQDDEIAEADRILKRVGGRFPAWQVLALFRGAMASPSLALGPNYFSSGILGEDHVFDDMAAAQSYLGVLVSLWNRAARNDVALSSARISERPTTAALRELAARRAKEIDFFLQGTEADGDEPFADNARAEALVRELVEAHEAAENVAQSTMAIGEGSPDIAEQMESVLRSATAVAEQAMTELASIGADMRAAELRRMVATRQAPPRRHGTA